MTTPYDLLALEPVRPGLAAKGSFKNSKSKGHTLVSITSKKFHFIVKSGLANVACNMLLLLCNSCSPLPLLPLLYSLAMFFCFFSKFRFIRKKCAAGLIMRLIMGLRCASFVKPR